MAKFKVGDRVRIVNLPDSPRNNTEATIIEIYRTDAYVVEMDGGHYNYTEDYLELVEKKVIAYKLKDDCEKYREAALKIAPGSAYLKKAGPKCRVNSITIVKLREAGVLDLWFEKVYEEEEPPVVIDGYTVEKKETGIAFGCQLFLGQDLEVVNRLLNLDFKITSAKGIEITKNLIKKLIALQQK
jgi:hypothetical protein